MSAYEGQQNKECCPSSMVRVDDTPLLHQTAANLTEAAMRSHRDPTDEQRSKTIQSITEVLLSFSPETLRRVHAFSKTSEAYYFVDHIIFRGEDETTVNDLIVLIPVLREDRNATTTKITLYIRGLSHYRGISQQREGHYPAQRLAQATAILRLTAYLRDAGVKTPVRTVDDSKSFAYITDERIRNLITIHDDPVALVDTIRTRGITTFDEIDSLLGTMADLAQPLQNGAL